MFGKCSIDLTYNKTSKRDDLKQKNYTGRF